LLVAVVVVMRELVVVVVLEDIELVIFQ